MAKYIMIFDPATAVQRSNGINNRVSWPVPGPTKSLLGCVKFHQRRAEEHTTTTAVARLTSCFDFVCAVILWTCIPLKYDCSLVCLICLWEVSWDLDLPPYQGIDPFICSLTLEALSWLDFLNSLSFLEQPVKFPS